MKNCIICNVKQDITEYYRHKGMKEGFLNKCKTCCKKQQVERHHRLMQKEDWVEKERRRGREKYKRLKYNELPKSTENKKINLIRYKNQSRRLNTGNGLEAHHWSYNYEDSDDVFILDVRLHRKIHTFIKFDEESQYFRCKDTNILLKSREDHKQYFLEKGYNLDNT